jgi:hypothetical protein
MRIIMVLSIITRSDAIRKTINADYIIMTTIEQRQYSIESSMSVHQREYLKLLYETTGGEVNWIRNDNWHQNQGLEPQPPVSSFFGVIVDKSDVVVQLRLGKNGLSGTRHLH